MFPWKMEDLKRSEYKDEDDWVLLVRCNSSGDTDTTDNEQALSISNRSLETSSTSAGSTRSMKRSEGGDEKIKNEMSDQTVIRKEDAFASTYALIGPLLLFVQEPRCGATSCFIGSTRITSGNCCTYTPLKGTTPNMSPSRVFNGDVDASFQDLSRTLCINSLTCIREPSTCHEASVSFPESEQPVHVAARDAETRMTTNAGKKADDFCVCPDVKHGATRNREARKAVSAKTEAVVEKEAATVAASPEARVKGVSKQATARQSPTATGETSAVNYKPRWVRRSVLSNHGIASTVAVESTVACGICRSEKDYIRRAENQQHLPNDVATEDDDEEIVTALEYEAYEPMALQQLRAACKRARATLPGVVKIAVMHLLGRCLLGHPGEELLRAAPCDGGGVDINLKFVEFQIYTRSFCELAATPGQQRLLSCIALRYQPSGRCDTML